MLLLAASAFEKASALPSSFWLKVILGIVGFFLAVILLKKLFEVNKVILAAVAIISVAVICINWVYERNEPAFLTPTVNILAEFLPTKGAYAINQATDPGLGKPKKPAAKH
jgi:hypothetical protein